MSKKHNQRTRTEILARRTPSTLPAPAATNTAGQRHIEGLRFTAATRRAMRSKYQPHAGEKQIRKDVAKDLVMMRGLATDQWIVNKFEMPF